MDVVGDVDECLGQGMQQGPVLSQQMVDKAHGRALADAGQAAELGDKGPNRVGCFAHGTPRMHVTNDVATAGRWQRG